MTAVVRGGPLVWEGERDDDGHRTFSVTHRVVLSGTDWGPAAVMTASGLPTPGSYWLFTRTAGSLSDIDVWAFCTPYMKVSAAKGFKQGEVITHWDVEQRFTTRPLKRCNTTTIEDPLLEPPRVSGSFVQRLVEAQRDRFGNLLKNSAHEMLKGPQVEFDDHTHQVQIEMNSATLDLQTVTLMMNTVNDAPLWGLPERCVKLSGFAWERLLYGVCNYYFRRSFQFDTDANTFDRDVPDEGTKVLTGYWGDTEGESTGTNATGWVLRNVDGGPPDPSNPQHFQRYKDRNGENCRVLLDGAGLPAETIIFNGTGGAGTSSGNVAQIHIEKYSESNFLLLGIPTSFIGLGTGTSEA